MNQEPFTLSREESVELDRPTQEYSLDRLIALNDGRFYRAMAGRTVRLVMAATRGIEFPQSDTVAVPTMIPRQDLLYFYFFTGPVELPPPDESIQDRPVWLGSARIDAGPPLQPGTELAKRLKRDDANWMALARPDLLIVSNRKDLLRDILERTSQTSKTRAFPADLPEWPQADRSATFWGVRHYTTASKPKHGERGCDAAELPLPDCSATGVTVRFDAARQRLEIRYLSGTRPAPREPLFGKGERAEFQADLLQTGVWRLVSDVERKGPWPVHFALSMLGFGVYR